MITDFNNPVSVAYKNIALETWKNVSNVEVEPWQCFTPETMKDAEHWSRMKWIPGLKSRARKYENKTHIITPTEQAVFCSMYYWWEHILKTRERIIILEHDAYVLNPRKLESLVEQIPHIDLWAVGISAECISFSPEFAEVLFEGWNSSEKPTRSSDYICSGPMGELHLRMHNFIQWKKKHPEYSEFKKKKYGLKEHYSFLWPSGHMKNRLCRGNTPDVKRGKGAIESAPVTQCYCPGFNTIEHDNDVVLEDFPKSHKFNRQFKFIDKLN